MDIIMHNGLENIDDKIISFLSNMGRIVIKDNEQRMMEEHILENICWHDQSDDGDGLQVGDVQLVIDFNKGIVILSFIAYLRQTEKLEWWNSYGDEYYERGKESDWSDSEEDIQLQIDIKNGRCNDEELLTLSVGDLIGMILDKNNDELKWIDECTKTIHHDYRVR